MRRIEALLQDWQVAEAAAALRCLMPRDPTGRSQPRLLHSVLLACAKVRPAMADCALSLLELAEKVYPPPMPVRKTYNIVLHACAQAVPPRFDAALAVVQRMRQAPPERCLQPDAFTYSSLYSASGRTVHSTRRHWTLACEPSVQRASDVALDAYAAMRAEGIPPNEYTYPPLFEAVAPTPYMRQQLIRLIHDALACGQFNARVKRKAAEVGAYCFSHDDWQYLHTLPVASRWATYHHEYPYA